MARLKPRLRFSRPEDGNGNLHDLRVGDDESAMAFIRFWASREDEILGSIHRKAYKQLAWVLGQQNQRFDYSRNILTDPAEFGEWPWWRVRAIENRLLGIVEGRLAKRNARQPIWKHKPLLSSDNDVSTSRIGTSALQHYWRRLFMAERLYQAEWWGEITGTGYLFGAWDPEAGPRKPVSIEGLSQRFGEPNQDDEAFFRELFGGESPEEMPLGDLRVGVHTVFDTIIDPHAKCPDEVQWVKFKRHRSYEYLEDRYGTQALAKANLRPDGMASGSKNRFGGGSDDTPYYYQVTELLSGSNAADLHTESDQYLVEELWVERSKRRPKGMHVVSVNGIVIRNQPNPYAHGRIPIMYVWGIPVEGSMFGTSKVEQLMETQQRLNEVRSNKHEYMRVHVYPKWLLPEGAEVADDAITTEFGEGIEYSGPQPPVQVPPPPMPNYMQNLEQEAITAFRDIGDLHEVSQGQTPGGVRSGTAIASLQGQDDARFVNLIKMRNLQLARFGGLLLHMLHQYVSEPRMIELVGEDETFDVMTFSGADLVGGDYGMATPEQFNVEVEIDSELPLSPEGQREIIQILVQNQILDRQADRDLILRMVGLGSADPVIKSSDQHRSLARKENRMISSDQWVPPERHHNHVAHLDVHERFMNSDQWVQLGDSTRKLFERHRAMHYQLQAVELLRGQIMTQYATQIAPKMFQEELQDIQQAYGYEPQGLPMAPGGAMAPPMMPPAGEPTGNQT